MNDQSATPQTPPANKTKEVVCDKCQYIFNLFDIELESFKKDDIKMTFLRCPNCDAKFICEVTDSKLRADMIKYRNKLLIHQKRYPKLTWSERIKSSNVLEKIYKSNLARSNELKEEYGHLIEEEK